MFGIGNIAEELMGTRAIVKCTDIDCRIIGMLHPAPAERTRPGGSKAEYSLLRFVHGTLETLQESCRSFLQITVSVASIDGFVSWDDAGTLVKRACSSLSFKVRLLGCKNGCSCLCIPPRSGTGMSSDRKNAAMANLDLLFQAIVKGDFPEAETQFKLFCRIYSDEGPEDPFDRMQLLHLMTNHLLTAIDVLGTKSQLSELDDAFALLRFDAQVSWPKALLLLHRWMKRISDLRSQEERQDLVKPLCWISFIITSMLIWRTTCP